LYYQLSHAKQQGTNAALWSLIAAMFYIRALTLREKMEEAKRNKGQVGQV
jgi:hypothetical protein